MTTDTRTSARTLAIALRLAPFVGLLFIGTAINNDAWFLLNCGRHVESYGIPHIEPFTLHAGWDYIMQQWLFALGLWKVYQAFGTAGLVASAWIAGAVLLYLFHRLVLEAAGGNRQAAGVIVVPAGCFLGLFFFCQRPQVASTAILLVEILLLERYRAAHPRWLYAALPLLSALLVNLHAAMWPMMLVFLLPYLAEALCGQRLARVLPHDSRWRVRELLLLAVLVVAAGFANPYGLGGVTYTAHAYGDPLVAKVVHEMHPVSMAEGFWAGGVPLVFMFALAAVYARHPVPLRCLLLAAGTAFMALSALRSLFLFVIFATFPLGRVLAGWQKNMPPATRRRRIECALMLAFDIVFFFFLLRPLYEKPPVPPQLAAATDELARLAAAEGRAPQDIRLYTGFDEGNYAEFCGFRCYLDTRAEVFLPAMNGDRDVFCEYCELQQGKRTYRDVLARYGFDALLVDGHDILQAYLPEDDGYACVWDSEAAGIPGERMCIYRKVER